MVTIFPANPIGAKTELLLNGVWTDISAYVLGRDNINITGVGRTDWTQSIQASQMTLTLNNTTGRFTPNNAAGAYYPYITLNTQLRLSISSESRTLVTYTGYRFWGEISEWPVAWDASGKDIYDQIVVSGIWRRLSQQQNTAGSPLRNYTQALSPQAFWSMEDGSGSLAFVSGIAGVANATWVAGPNGAPSLSNDNTSFLGGNSLPSLNQAKITANIPAGGTATNNVIRFALSVPAAGDSLSTTFSGGGQLALITTSGTVTTVAVSLIGNQLSVQGFVGGSTAFGPSKIATKVSGVPVLVSVELTPSGTTLNWSMKIIKPGGAAVLDSVSGTRASTTIGAVTSVVVDGQGRLNNTTFGELMVMYSSVPTLVTAAYALSGYTGELAMDRFTRLCAQFGIATETIGTAGTTQAMGPQTDDHLTDLLQMIENTDGGLLYELRDAFGLGYRSMVSMQNQAAAVVMNYATAMVAAPLAPAYDDQLIANTVTITAQDGYTIQAQLVSGAMSILVPPNGVGPGYTFTKSIAVAADSQVSAIATHYLNIGTVNDFRIPNVTVDLSRPAAASLFASVPGLRIGDFVQITNPPSFWSGSSVNQLVWGWNETITNYRWVITLNTVSELPWVTTFSPGTVSSVQLPGNATGSSSAPALVGGSAIGGGVITPGQISALTATLVGNLGVLNANPYFLGGDSFGWTALNGTFTVIGGLTGAPYAYAGQYTNNGVTIGAMLEGDTSGFGFPVTPGSQVMMTGWFNMSVTSVQLGFDFINAGGTLVSTLTSTQTVTAAAWTQLTTVQTVPAGAAWARPRAGSPAADGSTLYAQGIFCMPQVPGALIQSASIGPGQLSFTAGGVKVTIGSAPASPSTNDLWYDSANGYRLNQWSGTAWVATQLSGSAIANGGITATQILAGTITAAQIAAGTITGAKILAGTITASLITGGTITATQIATGTITAALLSAGIVVAGIVDSTTVQAQTYVATGTKGEFLAYAGTPGSGTLTSAIAGRASSDTYSNPFPIGLFGQALTLQNQSSAPPSFAGGSVFYSSTAGRPRYISSAGADAILERSGVNVSQFPIGNTTSPTNISAPLLYLANEASQSNEYEIEISGNGASGATSGSAGGQQLSMSLYIGGVSWGAGFIIGATTWQSLWATGSTAGFRYTIRFSFAILGGGSGGTAVGTSTGVFVSSSSSIQPNGSISVAGITSGSFDCAVNHTMQILTNWGGSSTGQALTTFRTRITRRD